MRAYVWLGHQHSTMCQTQCKVGEEVLTEQPTDSSGAVWVVVAVLGFRPNEPSGFRERKAILIHASALVSACP